MFKSEREFHAMVWESILFMFWASMGTFQIISAWARLDGLSFFPHRSAGYIFGTANIVGSFCWFFLTVELGEGGPKGQHDDQFVSFFTGIGSAILLTLILSSLLKFKSTDSSLNSNDENCGLDHFREKTLFQIARQCYQKNKEDK